MRNNRNTTGGFNQISDTHALCWKCGKEKPIENFKLFRKDQPNEYRLGYCEVCRKKQLYDNLNNNILSFLRDKYNRTKLRAKSKQIPFDISPSHLKAVYDQQKGKCFYTGITMEWGVGRGRNKNAISIDRVIPELGYITSNIVLCCNRVNTIKSDMTLEEMKVWCPAWYQKIVDGGFYEEGMV